MTYLQVEDLVEEIRETLRLPFCSPILHEKVLPLHITELPQTLLESRDVRVMQSCRGYDADPRDLRRLLRLHGERRSEHTGQRGQQEAAAVHHSMT
jgi:hypothetical protein